MGRDQQFKGSISISAPSSGDVRIELRDENSRQRFLEIRISYEELMRGLLGLAERPMSFEIGDTHDRARIGKKIHSEEIVVKIGPEGGISYDQRKQRAQAAVAKYANERSAKDGVHWVASTYFGSKDSFFSESGMLYCRTDMSYWSSK